VIHYRNPRLDPHPGEIFMKGKETRIVIYIYAPGVLRDGPCVWSRVYYGMGEVEKEFKGTMKQFQKWAAGARVLVRMDDESIL
jgi:hypothetical protein